MKALVYSNTCEVTYRDEADPIAGAGDALVQIDAVGICGSDMHAYHGHDPRRVPPLILGHKAAGVVLDGALAGRAVVLNPLITCGRCDYCTTGRANLCADRELIGMCGNLVEFRGLCRFSKSVPVVDAETFAASLSSACCWFAQ